MSEIDPVAEFVLVPDDFVAFQRFHILSQRRRLWLMGVFFVLVLPVLIVAGIGLAIFFDERRLPDFSILAEGAAALSALYIALLFGSFYVRLRWLMPRKYASAGFRHGMGLKRYALVPEGIDARSDIGTSMTRWSAVHRIAVGPRGVYFYLNPTLALILPRRAFRSEEGLRGFVAAAQTMHRQAWPEPPSGPHMDHVGGI